MGAAVGLGPGTRGALEGLELAGTCFRVGLSDCFAVGTFWISGLGIPAFWGEVAEVAALSACIEQFEDAFLT
jgi:hypothetical protein